MVDALNLLALAMQYAGDFMICLAAAIFFWLLAMEGGLD